MVSPGSDFCCVCWDHWSLDLDHRGHCLSASGDPRLGPGAKHLFLATGFVVFSVLEHRTVLGTLISFFELRLVVILVRCLSSLSAQPCHLKVAVGMVDRWIKALLAAIALKAVPPYLW